MREKEHATQRSVYHLDGMVGKLVEMRDFTGAFFNKISYLDTKLPVSQRRLALWMDKLQALQSQWFRTIGRYMIVYAPVGIRNRFVKWEKDVQASALKAKELRGEVGDIQLGSSNGNVSGSVVSASSTATTTRSMFGGTITQRPSASAVSAREEIEGEPTNHTASPCIVRPESLQQSGEDADQTA